MLPAPSPAIRHEVRLETEPDTFAPRFSSSSLISRRGLLKAPVRTKVRPVRVPLGIGGRDLVSGVHPPPRQTRNDSLVLGGPEPTLDRSSDHGADSVKTLDLLRISGGEILEAAESARQYFGGVLAHVGHPESEEEAVERTAFGLLELAEKFLGRELSPIREPGQAFKLEVPQRRLIGQKARLHELVEEPSTKPFDLHCAPGNEVPQPGAHYRWALLVGTPEGDLLHFANHGSRAHRTDFRRDEDLGPGRAF